MGFNQNMIPKYADWTASMIKLLEKVYSNKDGIKTKIGSNKNIFCHKQAIRNARSEYSNKNCKRRYRKRR